MLINLYRVSHINLDTDYLRLTFKKIGRNGQRLYFKLKVWIVQYGPMSYYVIHLLSKGI